MENNINKIRFIYVEASKHDNLYTYNRDIKFEVRIDIHKSLNIPERVTLEEACALASYLSLKVERENNLEECDPRTIPLVVEKMKSFGFTENDEKNMAEYALLMAASTISLPGTCMGTLK